MPYPTHLRHLPWVWLAACLLAILAGDLLAARFIRQARGKAVEAALLEMKLDLRERARALDAALRASRADLEFVAGSPPLAELPSALRNPDPAKARFHRLSADGDMLRYLIAHPEIARLFVTDGGGRPVLAVGRRASYPVPLALDAVEGPIPGGRLRAAAPLAGGEGALVADLRPASLLMAAGMGRTALVDARGELVAGASDAFRNVQEAPPDLAGSVLASDDGARFKDGWALAARPLTPSGYDPETTWRLVRAEREDQLLAGLGALAASYRTTVVLNVVGLGAALALGATAARLALRRARLEQEAERDAELRSLQARLHEADRMAAVGRTAAMLAHEVRNPLEGMQNWLALAEEEASEAGASGALRYTARVREGMQRLEAVVRRVLDLARPSAGTFEDVDLNGVARETIALVDATPAFRGVAIQTELAQDPPLVRGDRVLLSQLLLNLLLNARDAMPHGGAIRVTTRAVASELRLTVQDSGSGIPIELRETLFERGRSGKGSTGLGLSLCSEVARVHGGRMEATNAPSGGALFTLSIPEDGATPGTGGLQGNAA